MHEHNLQRITEIRKDQEEKEEKEKKQREREIEERKNELQIKKMKLEKKELELQERAALLDIDIRVNEFSITTRFGGLEKRIEELETATSSRDSFDLESNQRKMMKWNLQEIMKWTLQEMMKAQQDPNNQTNHHQNQIK